ncbi:MAG: P-loop NTPase [Aestuariivirga sp.]
MLSKALENGTVNGQEAGRESSFEKDLGQAPSPDPCASFARKVRVEILGLVENMSYLIAPQSKERIDVFGCGGGKTTAGAIGIPYLGDLPLDPAIRIGDTGDPVAWHDSPIFVDLARQILGRLEATAGPKGPKITIED